MLLQSFFDDLGDGHFIGAGVLAPDSEGASLLSEHFFCERARFIEFSRGSSLRIAEEVHGCT
jgi:hypothetical protein